jgi:hypothetical protein
MIDAVGIDLGDVIAAAARRSGDEIVAALVLPTAELGGDTPQHRLASLGARAAGSDAGAAVAVAIAPLDAAARAELEDAARAAFTGPLLVPRPIAAAHWFAHTNDVPPNALLVLVEAEESRVVVTPVRSRPSGLAIERPPVAREAHDQTAAVGAVATALTTWDLVPTDDDIAVIVGGAAWLPALAEGIPAAMGLFAVVDREPLAAAACGAALLARGPASRGGAALALGVPAAGVALLAVPEGSAAPGGAVAAAAGQALSGEAQGGGVAAAAGKALGAAGEGGGVAAAAGQQLSGAKARRAKHRPRRVGRSKHRPRRVGRPKGALLLAPLVVTLALGALLVRSCAGGGDSADLVTSAAPADADSAAGAGSTTTIASRQGPGGAKGTPGQAVPATDPATTATATSRPPSTTAAPRRPGTVPTSDPGVTPAPPAPTPPAPPPDVAPSVTGLARTAASIGADPSPFCCACDLPQTTQLSAIVTDASGLASVRVTWSSALGHGGTIDMSPGGGDMWTAQLGPIADAQMTDGSSTPVTWSVQAVDPAGHAQTVTAGQDAGVTLFGCVVVIG